MLKVEYFSLPQENLNKQIITSNEAKKHLHDVRIRRQEQLELIINECERLRHVHKRIFNCQFEQNSPQKPTTNHQINFVTNESPLLTKRYIIPRLEYASIIYRQVTPTFELDQSIKTESQSPLIKDLIENLPNSPLINSSCQFERPQSQSSSIRKSQFKCPSISPVPSLNKQTNRVYEKWPDYDHISQIVGYRIEPPPPLKPVLSNSLASRPSQSNSQRKSNKSTGFSNASKQIKTALGLSASPARRRSSKLQSISQLDLAPVIIDPPKPLQIIPPKEIKPRLPTYLCPSSANYSHRAQTRQWLIKNNFSSSACRARPLI